MSSTRTRTIRLQHHFDNMEQQSEASTLGMWVFLVTEIMFFGGLFMAYLVYRTRRRKGLPRPAITSNIYLGRRQHRRPDRQLADDGARGARGADERAAEDAGRSGWSRRWCWARRSSASRRSSTPTSSRTTSSPARTFSGRGSIPAAAEMFYSLYFAHDGPARAAHGHRARDHDGDRDHGVAAAVRRRLLHAGRGRRACTGTSSTSSGSSCSRCST